MTRGTCREARTQGTPICRYIEVTEDAASRRVTPVRRPGASSGQAPNAQRAARVALPRRRSPRGSSPASGGSAGRRASARSRPAAAICDCVRPLKKRRWRIVALALVEHAEPRREHRAILGHLVLVLDARRSTRAGRGRRRRRCRSRRSRATATSRRGPDSSASSTSSSSTPAAFASSGIVGERPSCTVSCSISRESWTFSSCSPRGTRTAQPLSRKWRLISPMMFGVAYVVSSTPRSRSKRSIALIRPIAPIWTRSSSCSPR